MDVVQESDKLPELRFYYKNRFSNHIEIRKMKFDVKGVIANRALIEVQLSIKNTEIKKKTCGVLRFVAPQNGKLTGYKLMWDFGYRKNQAVAIKKGELKNVHKAKNVYKAKDLSDNSIEMEIFPLIPNRAQKVVLEFSCLIGNSGVINFPLTFDEKALRVSLDDFSVHSFNLKTRIKYSYNIKTGIDINVSCLQWKKEEIVTTFVGDWKGETFFNTYISKYYIDRNLGKANNKSSCAVTKLPKDMNDDESEQLMLTKITLTEKHGDGENYIEKSLITDDTFESYPNCKHNKVQGTSLKDENIWISTKNGIMITGKLPSDFGDFLSATDFDFNLNIFNTQTHQTYTIIVRLVRTLSSFGRLIALIHYDQLAAESRNTRIKYNSAENLTDLAIKYNVDSETTLFSLFYTEPYQFV